MKVGSKLPYEELQIKFDFHHDWPTFSWVIALCSKFVFPDFSRLYFHISQWRLIESFHMKSYRLSLTFVTVDLLFHELLPFVQNLFSGLMVADLNLLGSVGDLYCFSNTLSMLVFVYFQGCAQVSLADFDPKQISIRWYNVLSFKFMQSEAVVNPKERTESKDKASLSSKSLTPSSSTSSSQVSDSDTVVTF